MRASPLLLILLAAVPARAGDWLKRAEADANAAVVPGEGGPRPEAKGWVPYESPSRLFHANLPAQGWRAYEEDDALGTVDRFLGPEDSGGLVRAAISVRLMDRDSAVFVPAKDEVEILRRDEDGRKTSPLTTRRFPAGLARLFEVTREMRAPRDEGPALPSTVHEFVAVIPRGEAYFVVRMISAREDYLNLRPLFVRFLKELRPLSGR
jgi:hypothetical protein